MRNAMDQDFSALINNYFQHDYRDRGIKKWRGFFLSDHTSALRKMDQDNVYSEKKLPKMTTDKIFHNAMHALANYYTVTIQLDETNFNHETKKNISGFIENMSDNYIYIENRKLAVQDIRALIINR
ncbi:hypothetical protein DIS11_08460 [Leuconostoc citreum]|nr:hypothetical protein DIS11_08460 [Leuconostoc citreum]